MKTAKNYKFWFATGSQDLYGDECLQKVAEHSKIIVNELNKSAYVLPGKILDSGIAGIPETTVASAYAVQ